ncbi:hypothetical protein LEP1GSC061_3221 [Leptospira wolffii serovar Khorat str. Khorat-H2]|nr:hypothetical protein LEP1GSC061_3221 [Leptospira wolffii serovar Khorat str. Khorat-H2]
MSNYSQNANQSLNFRLEPSLIGNKIQPGKYRERGGLGKSG